MSVLTRIDEALQYVFKGQGASNAPANPNTQQRYGERVPMPQRRGYINFVEHGYKRNRVVTACIGIRASGMSEPPMVVTNDKREFNYSHPITTLLRKPNPLMSQAGLWQHVSTYIDLSGECYLIKRRGVYGQVAELWLYNTGQMAPIYSEMGWVTGYVYANGLGVPKLFPASDVIHLRHPIYIDPMNLNRGLSSVELASTDIEIYNELMDTTYSLVANNATPAGVISTPPGSDFTEVQQKSIREQLQKRLGISKGAERTRPLFVSSGATYTQMGLDAQKLQAKELLIQCETGICAIFGLDPDVARTVAGAEKSTYNNREAAYKEFTTLTRMPWWNSIEEQMETGLREEWPNITLEFDMSHVAALRADPDATIYPNIAKFNANIVTQNEARVSMGDAPLDDGDKFAFQVVPPPTFGALAVPDEQQTKVDDDGIIDSIVEKSDDGLVRKIKWNETKALVYWKTQETIVADATNQITGAVRAMFDSALSQLTSSKSAMTVLDVKKNSDINLRKLLDQFMAATGAIRQKLLTDIIGLAVRSVGGDLTQVISYMDEIDLAATREVSAKIKESLGTMQSDVIRVFDANAGKSAAEISQALKDQFATMKGSRADMIAQTTTKAQSTKTLNVTWEGMDKRETDPKRKLKKVWMTQRDSDVRDSHEVMDGQVVDMGEMFVTGNGFKMAGPGLGDEPSEAIRDRCTIRAVRAGQL